MSLGFDIGSLIHIRWVNQSRQVGGRIARRAAIRSDHGLAAYQSTAPAKGIAMAAGCGAGINSPSSMIATAGNSDASVTMPKPDNGLSSLPVAAATPTPIATTIGTVTGPVVIAPQSHANPRSGA